MNAGAAALGERLLDEIQEESFDEVGRFGICDRLQLLAILKAFHQLDEWR